MKAATTVVGLLGVCVTVAACVGGDDPDAKVPEMDPPMAPASAIEQVASARCQAEIDCGNVGETKRFSDREHCMATTRDALTEELADDADCKNGISREDLDECITEIETAECGGARGMFDAWRATMECGSKNLCLD
jgi:hypothetical protein